jgi:hypothetical protein
MTARSLPHPLCPVCQAFELTLPPPGPDRFAWLLRYLLAHYHSDPTVRGRRTVQEQQAASPEEGGDRYGSQTCQSQAHR